ncbi:MAG: hypothetical protein NZ826_08025 [Thermodesulfovibrio sp.]|nr:hypothetical protein [Thermodesulfovibrio sp.]
MRLKKMHFLVVFFIICVSIGGWAQEKYLKRIVSERLIAQIDFSSWIKESFKVSPDSKRVAYVAGAGNKWFVVIDGKEGKKYDGIGGKIIFDSSDSLHYLSGKKDKIYLVEEKIK